MGTDAFELWENEEQENLRATYIPVRPLTAKVECLILALAFLRHTLIALKSYLYMLGLTIDTIVSREGSCSLWQAASLYNVVRSCHIILDDLWETMTGVYRHSRRVVGCSIWSIAEAQWRGKGLVLEWIKFQREVTVSLCEQVGSWNDILRELNWCDVSY